MSGPVDALKAAGYGDDEISAWASDRRNVLSQAGYKDNEIDAYFTGGVVAPENVPEAVDRRLAEGEAAQKREGGLMQTLPQAAAMVMTPQGRAALWDAVKSYPSEFVKSMIETGKTAEDVGSGAVDLSTPEGMDKAIGLGMLIGLGRFSKLPMTGRTSGFSVAMGEQVARIDRGPTGEIIETPIGSKPTAEDFSAASKVIGGADAPLHVQEKLLKIYEDTGRFPAEVAHDAQTDPVLAQRLLSKDPAEVPYITPTPLLVVARKMPDGTVRYGEPGDVHSDLMTRKELSNDGATPADIESSMGYARPGGPFMDRNQALEFAKNNEPARAAYSLEQPEFGLEAATYNEPKAGGGKPPPEPPEPPAPGSFEDAQKKVLDQVSIGEREPGNSPYTFRHIYTQLIDDLHPLKDVSTAAYEMARLTRGTVGKAAQFLENGTFDFETYKTNGPALREVLAPVRDDLDGLRAYMTSKRAIELEGREIKSGLDGEGLEAAQRVVGDGAAKFEKPFREVVDYQNRVLKYMKDSGVLTDKAYDAMVEAGQNYVPFYRLIGGEAGGPARGRSLGPGNPLKAIKGSERKIVDPLESIIKNTYAYLSIADRNAVGIELVDALKKEGFAAESKAAPRSAGDAELVDHLKSEGVSDPKAILDFIKRAAPEDGDTIGAFRNGVREEVKVNDPDLVAAFRGLSRDSVGLLTKILAAPARALRAGAVLTPEFMSRNLIRDFMTAFVNTSRGVFTPADTIKGLTSVLRRDEHFQDWVKGGGGNATMVGLDRRYLQESLEKLTADTGLMTRSWNVIASPLSGLRMLSELTENATRVGEFRRAMAGQQGKSAIQNAAYASREVTLDFSRIGAKVTSYNLVTAFANAQIQGVDRVVRQFHDRPVNTMAKVAGGITLPSVLLWWANHDDERYKELPDWEKDLFWIIPTDKWEPTTAVDAASKPEHLVRERNGQWQVNNGAIFRIPKPFELGVVFGSGPERILEATIGKNPEAFDGFTKSVMQVLSPNFIPTAAQPMFEQWANRSSFTNRTLIPADVEKQLPEYQYTPYTTELTKKLSQIVSAFPGLRQSAVEPDSNFGGPARALSTPILVENYIRAWSGGLGMYGLNLADTALRKAGALPDPIKPTPTLADIPFVKGFVARYPDAGGKSIQGFYDAYESNKRYFDTFMAKAKDGDIVALMHIQEMGGPMMFAQLDGIKSVLSEHSQIIKDINKNPELPAGEKRQLIDSLYYSMIQVSQYGNQAVRQMRAQSEAMDARVKAVDPDLMLTPALPVGQSNGHAPL